MRLLRLGRLGRLQSLPLLLLIEHRALRLSLIRRQEKARKGNNEGAVEHADAASFVLAGESSLSGAAFAASYDPASWGNPGAIQQAKVYASVPVW
jgi:hypothetical protein